MSAVFTWKIHDGADLPHVLFDTNVVLDLFLKREPFLSESAAAIGAMVSLKPRSFIATSTVTDLHYVLRKALGSDTAAHDAIEEVLNLFDLADTIAFDIYSAHESKAPDFEDSVIASITSRMMLDYLVTRNVKDYKLLPVHAVTPHEFLKLIRGPSQ